MLGRATDDEALRLTMAFYCIMEPERRAQVMEMAERFAAQSEHVEGLTHFLDLTPRTKN
jgi:hypothetical protein